MPSRDQSVSHFKSNADKDGLERLIFSRRPCLRTAASVCAVLRGVVRASPRQMCDPQAKAISSFRRVIESHPYSVERGLSRDRVDFAPLRCPLIFADCGLSGHPFEPLARPTASIIAALASRSMRSKPLRTSRGPQTLRAHTPPPRPRC